MKRLLFFFGLLAVTMVFDSCTKDKDPEPDPIVGSWSVDRVKYSGFTGDFASFNDTQTDLSNPNLTGYRDDYEFKADKTFTETVRQGTVFDYSGTWDRVNNEVTLKYDQGDQETFTLDNTSTPFKLTTGLYANQDSILNPKTQKPELVKYNQQYIYSKK